MGNLLSSSNDDLEDGEPRQSSLGIVRFFQNARAGYDELVNAIIRPPRCEYEVQELGPPFFEFLGHEVIREDVELRNQKGQLLVCSHWRFVTEEKRGCCVYLHGNASGRVEALSILSMALSLGLSVFALDCSGSGFSEGQYVSLGWFESEDLQVALDHLETMDNISQIVLWGRSMGAVSCLLYEARASQLASARAIAKPRAPDINGATAATAAADEDEGKLKAADEGKLKAADEGKLKAADEGKLKAADEGKLKATAMVLDSPFCDFAVLAEELVDQGREQGVSIPGFLMTVALQTVRSSVQKRAGFDVLELAPVKKVHSAQTPAMFVAAEDDELIPVAHSEKLLESYGDSITPNPVRRMAIVPGDHNSARDHATLDITAAFLMQQLEMPPGFPLQVPEHGFVMMPWGDEDMADGEDYGIETIFEPGRNMGMTKDRHEQLTNTIANSLSLNTLPGTKLPPKTAEPSPNFNAAGLDNEVARNSPAAKGDGDAVVAEVGDKGSPAEADGPEELIEC